MSGLTTWSGRVLQKAAFGLALAFALGVLGLTVVARLEHWHTVTVTGSSMASAVPLGSMAFIEEVRPEQVRTGDVVTVRHPSYGGAIISHRVVAISPEGRITLKGDANALPDPDPIELRDVHARVVFVVPYVGYAVSWLSAPVGRFVLVFVPAALLFASQAFILGRAAWSFARRRRVPVTAAPPTPFPAESLLLAAGPREAEPPRRARPDHPDLEEARRLTVPLGLLFARATIRRHALPRIGPPANLSGSEFGCRPSPPASGSTTKPKRR